MKLFQPNDSLKVTLPHKKDMLTIAKKDNSSVAFFRTKNRIRNISIADKHTEKNRQQSLFVSNYYGSKAGKINFKG